MREPPVPSRALFWTLLASTGGLFTASSVRSYLRHAPHTFSNGRVLQLIVEELVLASIWLVVLRRRGWSFAVVTEQPATADLGHGLGLAVFTTCTSSVALFVALGVSPSLRAFVGQAHSTGGASLVAILAVSIVNPLFEELVLLGFLTNVLRRRGELVAVGASTLLRMTTHLYQGPIGVISIAICGIILGIYYYRSQRLWPVIFAHSLIDAWALAHISWSQR